MVLTVLKWKSLLRCLQFMIACYCSALALKFAIWPFYSEIKKYVDGAFFYYPPVIFSSRYEFSERERAWLPELRAYAREHLFSLNESAAASARVLVCDNVALNGHGLCNRLNHLVSCAMTALVLNRRLVVNWNRNYDSVNWRVYDDYEIHFENMHIDAFHEIFQTYDANASDFFLDADSGENRDDSDCADMNPAQFVYIASYHGSKRCLRVLEHHLEWFSSTPFFRRGPEKYQSLHFFAAVAKYFFQPKYDLHHFKWAYSRQVMAQCRTLFQRRTRWGQPFPSLKQMQSCAAAAATLDYVLTDVQDASSLSPVSYHFAKYCRGEYHCDSDMLHVMYQFSACSSAVVTEGSTFGLCIVYLGAIENAVVASAAGTCTPLSFGK